MNNTINTSVHYGQAATLSTNRVIRNTYTLLAMTLLFSGLTAAASMALNLPGPGLVLTLGGYFALLFLTTKFRDSAAGLGFVFALTGFMGYTLGPILNSYLALPNGGQIVMTAMGATGAIFSRFVGLCTYYPQGFQLHGRLPDDRHTGCFSGKSGQYLLYHTGTVTCSIVPVCTADVWPHPVSDQ